MKYPKILLTGVTGQVGHELRHALKRLGSVWAPRRNAFDLENPEALRAKIKAFQPDLIVNAGAYTAVEQAELEINLAQVVNAHAPRILAEEARKLCVPLIHYSTDYVFDGTKTEPYNEEDAANPLNIYGKTKLEGERAIQSVHDQYLILRTSWVYSRVRGENFYRTMLKLFKEKDIIYVVTDQIGAPTSVQFLAEKTAQILSQLETKEQGEDRWGVYHLTGPDMLSRYEFAHKILGEVKDSLQELKVTAIQPISSNEFKSAIKRPTDGRLCCMKISRAFNI